MFQSRFELFVAAAVVSKMVKEQVPIVPLVRVAGELDAGREVQAGKVSVQPHRGVSAVFWYSGRRVQHRAWSTSVGRTPQLSTVSSQTRQWRHCSWVGRPGTRARRQEWKGTVSSWNGKTLVPCLTVLQGWCFAGLQLEDKISCPGLGILWSWPQEDLAVASRCLGYVLSIGSK